MQSRIVIIRNPVSGTGAKLEDLLPGFASVLKSHSMRADLECWYTEAPDHATELARKAAREGVDLCIAAGGDGTMHEVALGLMGTQTVLGLLPLGSGNGLARHIGLSMEPRMAFEQLVTGESHWMDAGEIDGKPFFLAAGFGFEGVVAHRFAKSASRGFSQYIRSSVEAYFTYRPLKLGVAYPGRNWEGEVFTSTIANGAQYGNNAWIAPNASLTDGMLDWTRILPFPFWKGPGLFCRLLNRKLSTDRYFQSEQTAGFQIEFPGRVEGHLDGEPVYFDNKVKVECLKAALQIRIPSQATI
jgi:YegS/Rv2252/BmrU family lipid kinase